MRHEPALRVFATIDVYESATEFILVGHEGKRRRILRIDRRASAAVMGPSAAQQRESSAPHTGGEGAPPLALPPVSEDPRTYTEQECRVQLDSISAAAGEPALSERRSLRAAALLGMVRFLEGWYMLFVTRAEVAGVIAGHSIHRVEETAMISVVNPADVNTSVGGGSGGQQRPSGSSKGGGGGSPTAARSLLRRRRRRP